MSTKRYEHGIDLNSLHQLENFRIKPVSDSQLTQLESSLNTDNRGLLVYNTDQQSMLAWSGTDFLKVSGPIPGNVIYKGTVDALQSLDNQCEPVPGYLYLITNQGQLDMTGVNFISFTAVSSGDFILFTGNESACVIQGGSIGTATTENSGIIPYWNNSDISDNAVISPRSLSTYLRDTEYVNSFSTVVDLQENTLVIVEHSLRLKDINSFVWSCIINGSNITVDIMSVSYDSIGIISPVTIENAVITILGSTGGQLIAPSITSITNYYDQELLNGVSSTNSVRIQVVADPGQSITIVEGDNSLGICEEISSGAYLLKTTGLSQGSHTVFAKLFIQNNEFLFSDTVTFTINSIYPETPAITSVNTPSGILVEHRSRGPDSDFIVKIDAESSGQVSVYNGNIDGGTFLGNAQEVSPGKYEYYHTLGQVTALHLRAYLTNNAGNTSRPSVEYFIVMGNLYYKQDFIYRRSYDKRGSDPNWKLIQENFKDTEGNSWVELYTPSTYGYSSFGPPSIPLDNNKSYELSFYMRQPADQQYSNFRINSMLFMFELRYNANQQEYYNVNKVGARTEDSSGEFDLDNLPGDNYWVLRAESISSTEYQILIYRNNVLLASDVILKSQITYNYVSVDPSILNMSFSYNEKVYFRIPITIREFD